MAGPGSGYLPVLPAGPARSCLGQRWLLAPSRAVASISGQTCRGGAGQHGQGLPVPKDPPVAIAVWLCILELPESSCSQRTKRRQPLTQLTGIAEGWERALHTLDLWSALSGWDSCWLY